MAGGYLLSRICLNLIKQKTISFQIENGDNWNNPYMLTVQLNGILCSKFPDMNSLFTVQVERRSYYPKNVLSPQRSVKLILLFSP